MKNKKNQEVKMLDGYKTYIVGIEDKITTLESELCKKDNTYNWC